MSINIISSLDNEDKVEPFELYDYEKESTYQPIIIIDHHHDHNNNNDYYDNHDTPPSTTTPTTTPTTSSATTDKTNQIMYLHHRNHSIKAEPIFNENYLPEQQIIPIDNYISTATESYHHHQQQQQQQQEMIFDNKFEENKIIDDDNHNNYNNYNNNRVAESKVSDNTTVATEIESKMIKSSSIKYDDDDNNNNNNNNEKDDDSGNRDIHIAAEAKESKVNESIFTNRATQHLHELPALHTRIKVDNSLIDKVIIDIEVARHMRMEISPLLLSDDYNNCGDDDDDSIHCHHPSAVVDDHDSHTKIIYVHPRLLSASTTTSS